MSRRIAGKPPAPGKPLKMEEVEICVLVEEEVASVKGNAMASGDDAFDDECNQAILKRLARGEVWAWCSVMVVAKWQGFEGVDSLGCCSYEDEADFRVGPYFEDMRVQALERLNESVKRFLDRAHRVRAALAAR